MIRPLTLASFLLAWASCFYLYQAKHEAQVLDATIKRAVRDTGVLRQQARRLAAEWTLLNDPERLRRFADMYLHLRPASPAQFTGLADLAGRLPRPEGGPSEHGQGDGAEVSRDGAIAAPTAAPAFVPAPAAAEPAPRPPALVPVTPVVAWPHHGD